MANCIQYSKCSADSIGRRYSSNVLEKIKILQNYIGMARCVKIALHNFAHMNNTTQVNPNSLNTTLQAPATFSWKKIHHKTKHSILPTHYGTIGMWYFLILLIEKCPKNEEVKYSGDLQSEINLLITTPLFKFISCTYLELKIAKFRYVCV